eukprot:TRINITY_DN3870_c0_g1_i2.p1 TRINITY_DN3870_c0_g1~~TRINITY_DN3870_c0_g1_i2.p1  ORF type:complete len:456 (-),score=58.86 TRINITY_DN3870_c0_g1_i2:157-1524(-)
MGKINMCISGSRRLSEVLVKSPILTLFFSKSNALISTATLLLVVLEFNHNLTIPNLVLCAWLSLIALGIAFWQRKGFSIELLFSVGYLLFLLGCFLLQLFPNIISRITVAVLLLIKAPSWDKLIFLPMTELFIGAMSSERYLKNTVILFFLLSCIYSRILEVKNSNATFQETCDKYIRKLHKRQNQLSVQNKFIATLTHEIRNIAGSIATNAAILQENKLYSEEIGSELFFTSKALLEMINNALDISKLEEGKVELNLRYESIYSAIDMVLRVSRSSSSKKNLRLSTAYSNQIPDLFEIDRSRLTQVILNLVSNAVKFTPNGGKISINTSWEFDRNNEGMCPKSEAIIKRNSSKSMFLQVREERKEAFESPRIPYECPELEPDSITIREEKKGTLGKIENQMISHTLIPNNSKMCRVNTEAPKKECISEDNKPRIEIGSRDSQPSIPLNLSLIHI